ncbi:helix-turn-helix domain-containing protein [Streptomyces acidiscabies]|uniref:helix-turn-helix domain-containing protein n=1 Tax=Streptomyces acidiscabies TaxID=42234 RepID=UPI00073F21FF|nr:helix-turn-helix domain-containing protein [Streptomyces acidiscabies]GAQ52126.1 hypothetical protein a10_01907 [Streptomyces acidiscabies]
MTEPRDATPRTDLKDLVVRRKQELGLSYEKLAARCVVAGVQTVKYSWLHRLATGKEVLPPDFATLEGLATGLDVPLTLVQEAAGRQFFRIDTAWSDDQEVRALIHEMGDLDDDDRARLRVMMQSWRKLKQG